MYRPLRGEIPETWQETCRSRFDESSDTNNSYIKRDFIIAVIIALIVIIAIIVQVPRKPPTQRNYEHPLLDETNKFLKQDIFKRIDDLNDSSSPRGYHYNKINDKIMFMKFTYANDDGTSSLKCIMVDENLHVNLSIKVIPFLYLIGFGKARVN